jgi:phytoene desaturase
MTDRKLERIRYAMSLVVIYFGTKKRYAAEGTARAPQHPAGTALQGAARRHLPQPRQAGRRLQPLPAHAHDHRPDDRARGARVVLRALAGAEPQERHLLGAARGSYRDAIMQHLEDHYLPDLQANLVTERFVDPRYFAAGCTRPRDRRSRWSRS